MIDAPPTLTLIQQPNGCAAWRVAWPAYELHAQGYRVAWGYLGLPEHAAQVEYAELVVLQRSSWQVGDEDTALAFRDFLHAHGKALGYETDDDLYSEASIERIRSTGDAELNARSDAQLEAERATRIFALQIADGVTVSTPHLASVVRRFTDRPVYIVPNALDLPRFRAAIDPFGPRPAAYPLTIGWAGGNRPDRDALQLARAWRQVALRYPQVQFVVGGYPLRALLEAVPPDQRFYVDKQSISHYPATLSMIDIGCCPLNPEPFNLAKSPIKAWEYAAAGAAVVASPTVYGDVLEDGVDALICRTADDWEAALELLINQPELRRDLADRLLAKVVTHHTLQANAWRWPQAWSALVGSARRRGVLATVQPSVTPEAPIDRSVRAEPDPAAPVPRRARPGRKPISQEE